VATDAHRRAIIARHAPLAAIVALAAVARFWGLAFGMPHVQARPDELILSDISRTLLRGDPNPHFFDYPSLFMYVVAGLDYVYYLFGRGVGWFSTLDQFINSWLTQWTPFFLMARALSATAGTITVVAVAQLATLISDRRTGLVAAFCLALAFLHVRDSHFGVTDVSMTLFIVLSVSAVLVGHVAGDDTSGGLRWFALGGVAAGVGAAFKYSASVAVAPAIVAAAIASWDARRVRARGLLAFIAASCLAFAAGSPFVLLDGGASFRDIVGVAQHVATAHNGLELGPGGIYHLTFSLRYGLGIPLLVAGIVGLGLLAVSTWRVGALVVAFPVAYWFVLTPSRTVFVRYALPVVPFLCVGAAVALVALARRIEARFALPGGAVAALLAVVVVVPSAYSVIQIDRLFATVDNRLVVADWLRTHAMPGHSMYLAGSSSARPVVELEGQRLFRYFDYAGGEFTERGMPVTRLPDWLVLPETGVPEYSDGPPAVKRLAEERYVLAGVFAAMDLSVNLFDRQDAFYYPYAGFQRARRGGPNYFVYVRRPDSP